MVSLFGSVTYRALRSGLDAASVRHQVISNNLANVDTPGYRDRVVSFEDELKAALEGGSESLTARATRPGHITSAQPVVEDVRATVSLSPATSWRVDGNTVDVDVEVTRMMSNQSLYRTLARVVGDEHKLLRIAITGSGR